ncbi:MAG: site-specific integrase [Verrucomicrobia bacterium]|nr:site-specific integrase [Verrucomicrobiota bacterium]
MTLRNVRHWPVEVKAGSVMEGLPRSKNNARQTLGAFLKFARERGWLPRDHEGIALVPKFKAQTGAIEIFAPWELVQYLNHVREELVPFVAIGAFAGLRHAEIGRLDWREVRLADRFIEVTAEKAKTASRRLVPITDNLVKWLTPHAQKAGRVVPFENVNKQIAWLVRDTNRALKAEGKAAGRDPEKAPKLEWKKNALRHSFISYRLAEVQSAAQVALEAGNSPRMIFQHYRELVRPKEAKSWFSITPGEDGKILYVLADGQQKEGQGIAGAADSERPALDRSAVASP